MKNKKLNKKWMWLPVVGVIALALPQMIMHKTAYADAWFCEAPGTSCIELNINDCKAVHGPIGICESGFSTIEACDAATSCTY